MCKPKIQFYDIPTLESLAGEFLSQFHDKKKLEVDIEYILEGKLGYMILPFSSLAEFHGIEAAVLPKRKTIYVDQYLMDYKERKYRFTLAEELSHIILHKELYAECSDIDDMYDIYEKISAEDYHRMDRNAKYLASAMLLPADAFKKRAIEIYEQIDRKKVKTNEKIIYRIVTQLTEDFNLGDYPTAIRFGNLGLHHQLISL